MLISSVRETIKREKLIQVGDIILVALSGGADSMCLLDVLFRLKEEYQLQIYVAHLNHQIRGLDAQKDAIYCREVCDRYNVPFFLKTEDIPLLSKKRGKSLEETARQVRYEMLFDIKSKIHADKIAVAHNLDDQAETVLMKLFRGSGLQGLRGMEYARQDGIIRPLLDSYKRDILLYCQKYDLHPRMDYTNLQEEYTRNKIRLDLLPYLEEKYSSNIKKILARTANIIGDDYHFLEKVAGEKYALIKKEEDVGKVILDVKRFQSIDVAIQKRVIRIAIGRLLSDLNNIESIHVEAVLDLSVKKNHKMLHLPRDIKVYIEADNLIFSLKELQFEEKRYSYKLKINGYTTIDELNATVMTQVISKEEYLKYPASTAKAFDYDKIQGDLFLRSRNIGDRIKPIGLKGSKKIKDILIDKKIPVNEKYKYPILSDDNGILCLFGYRISEEYKIDENTKRVINVQLKEE